MARDEECPAKDLSLNDVRWHAVAQANSHKNREGVRSESEANFLCE